MNTSIILIVVAVVSILSLLNTTRLQRQIRRAQERGLWPQRGEVPTIQHVEQLAKAGEKILAMRLYRQIHPASLVDAKAIVEKMAV